MVIDIILLDTVEQTDRLYSYNLHSHMDELIQIGSRVLVPFGRGNRIREAMVFGMREGSIDGYKFIHHIFDEGYNLNQEMISLINYLKEYYLSSTSRLIKTMIPSGTKLKIETEYLFKDDLVKDRYDNGELLMDDLIESGDVHLKASYSSNNSIKYKKVIVLKVTKEALKISYDGLRKNAVQQLKLFELFLNSNLLEMSYDEMNIPLNVIKKFADQGIFEIKLVRNYRQTLDREVNQLSAAKHQLNDEQKEAFDRVNEMIQEKKHQSFLLHGVTGSGKTEVYLQLTEEVLKKGESVIVLVPEIALVPQMAQRFIERFGDVVGFYHSKMNNSERMDEWFRMKNGEFKIVIGARSAIFAPMDSIGLIIVDEEHSSSYKSEQDPKYEAKHVASLRSEYHDAVVLYGSATPSVEIYSKTQNHQIELLELKKRVKNQKMPTTMLVDMRDELNTGNRSIFSRVLKEKIQQCIDKDEQCILFLNKIGYSSFVSCRSCGYVVKCPSCDLPLIYHKRGHFGECKICGYKKSLPQNCPECGSQYFKHFGIGTEKVEEMINKTFFGAKTLRMDRISMQRKNALYEAYEGIQNNDYNIILGTQIVAKGHDFKKVTLVGILAADINLNVPSFNASETAYQLLTQAIGRSGRDIIQGEVVIQTYSPEHYAVLAAHRHDYHLFIDYELNIRKTMNYPPYKQLINIMILSSIDQNADKISKKIAKELKFQLNGYEVQIMGPGLAILEKAKGLFRYQIVLKLNEVDQKEIKGIISNICHETTESKTYVSIDVNPVSLI